MGGYCSPNPNRVNNIPILAPTTIKLMPTPNPKSIKLQTYLSQITWMGLNRPKWQKNRHLTKNTCHKWYSWLISCIPQSVKRSESVAKEHTKNHKQKKIPCPSNDTFIDYKNKVDERLSNKQYIKKIKT